MRPDIIPPHDKYCISISSTQEWFFYINSEPPPFKKAREFAVEVENFEAHFLSHTSYIDVVHIIRDVPEAQLREALANPSRQLGRLAPFLIDRIKASVAQTPALSANEKAEILS
jgi:hypothetical protein